MVVPSQRHIGPTVGSLMASLFTVGPLPMPELSQTNCGTALSCRDERCRAEMRAAQSKRNQAP